MSFLDDTYNKLVALKTKFNTGLEKACVKFPEESSLHVWKTKQVDFVLVEQEIVETQQLNAQVNEEGGQGRNDTEGNEEGGNEEGGEEEIGENEGEGNGENEGEEGGEEGSEGGNKEGIEGGKQGEGNGEENEVENEGKSEEGREVIIEEKDATECGDEETELDTLIKSLSTKNTENMGEKIQTEAEEQNIETFTQFLQNPDVIESFDRIVAEKTAEKEAKENQSVIESTTNEVGMPTNSDNRQKVSDAEESSAPSYSLGLTQEFGEGYATEDRMVQKDGCKNIDI